MRIDLYPFALATLACVAFKYKEFVINFLFLVCNGKAGNLDDVSCLFIFCISISASALSFIGGVYYSGGFNGSTINQPVSSKTMDFSRKQLVVKSSKNNINTMR
jgi:hypothetical protein